MRTAHALLSLSVLLVTSGAAGAIATGCINSGNAPPPSLDAGSFSLDGGSFTFIDATVDGSTGITTTPIDFGLVGCGKGGAPRTYSFANPGPGTLVYSATITGGSAFTIEGESAGRVAPGGRASITLAVSEIPTNSTAGVPVVATLALTTNVPGLTAVNVPLKATPQGGALTVTPALAGFGQVQLTTQGTLPFQISNTGNAPVTITFGPAMAPEGGADPEFGLFYAGSPGPTTIVAGGTAGAGATFTPTTPGTKSVNLAIQTNDPICASSIFAIAMSGTGTAAQLTVGPNPLQFGLVPCGQAVGPLQVTLTNTSLSSIGFTDALGLGTSSPFRVDVTAGSVPAANGSPGTAVITVTPKAIPIPGNIAPGAFNDTLVITPTAQFVGPTTIAIDESASGAILAVTMDGGTAFGPVASNQTGSLPFNVTNTGNVDAPLTVDATGSGYAASFTSAADAPADGGLASGTVTFSPTVSGSTPGSLKVSTTAPICSVAPTITLSATGSLPVASVPSTPIAAGAICGGTTTQGTVTITNTGAAPLTISGAKSVSGKFTVVSTVSPIAVGASGDITIQPVALGQGIPALSTVSDTLSFTTNESGSPTHTVDVAIAVSGANVGYVGVSGNAVSIDTPNCGAELSYSVTNTGNMPATVTALGAYPTDGDTNGDKDVFDFGGSFSSPTVIAVGSPVADSLQNQNLCLETEQCTLTTTQSFSTLNSSGTAVGICIPLPPLSLSLNYCDCQGGC